MIDNDSRERELLELFNNRAPIARYFGMKLSFITYNGERIARIDLPYNPNLDHALGGIHGGVYSTLLDNAGWFTAAISGTHLNTWLVTSDLNIRLLEPVSQQALYSIGKIIKKGKRLIITAMKLFSENQELLAYATGSFIPLSKK